MARWAWTQRTFQFDFPVEKMPDLLERLRGTPSRLEDRTRGLSARALCASDGGWSIKQNIGHLIDLGYLPLRRIEQILASEAVLIAADTSNAKTNGSNHNARPLAELLAQFRMERKKLIERFEAVSETEWGRAAKHPRLMQPMRLVDIAYFDSEHDDYHLARIGELIRKFGT